MTSVSAFGYHGNLFVGELTVMSVLELPCGDAAFSNFFLFLPILLARDHGPCTQTPEQYITSIPKQELRRLPNIVHKSRDRQYILQAKFRTHKDIVFFFKKKDEV